MRLDVLFVYQFVNDSSGLWLGGSPGEIPRNLLLSRISPCLLRLLRHASIFLMISLLPFRQEGHL